MVAFVTFSQRRWTGGIRFILDKFQAHLDPGPGAIVRSVDAKLDPRKVNVLLVSHSHPDHYGDAETFIEAMTEGTTRKKGTLVASHSVLFGNDACEASISKYHQRIIGRVIEAKPGDSFDIGELKVRTTRALHSDPEAVGYCFNVPEAGIIGYTSDTEFFHEMEDYYEGVRLLILCVMRPSGSPWQGHMTTDDAIEIIKLVKPEAAIFTHFGLKMLMNNPEKQAKSVEEKTGIPVKAAFDGMRVTMNSKEIFYSMRNT
ncbi:MAG: hypothetical protein QG670_370 [Thermoproteota archaeon]|nr:hypothetical protein [Thermoproteota archaeon]